MLPSWLKASLDERLEGVARTDLANRARRLSEFYRRGNGSGVAVRDDLDVLAYAVARMPATYAAVTDAVMRSRPHIDGFEPHSLLDLGAGPGGSTFAALEAFPGIAHATMIETNPKFRNFATRLIGASGNKVEIISGDLTAGTLQLPFADLVVASYVLAELPPNRLEAFVERALGAAMGLILFVEPGTPDGFRRIRRARELLIANGAAIVAPCPGQCPCPMVGTDWCHFSVRLPRSRDHMFLKAAAVPFEDERFSYVAATRKGIARPALTRVLAEPAVGRTDVTLKLCTSDGARTATVPLRDKVRGKLVRKIKWGDATEL